MYDIIDTFCNSFKVKYMYLDKLFNGALETKNKKGRQQVEVANIFINFESLYNCTRNNSVEKHLKAASTKELSSIYRCMISNFINVAAHYRKYFTNKKIKTRIFFYYNEIPDENMIYNNTAMVPNYRHHFMKSLKNLDLLTVSSIIQESIQFMKIITEYIDDVYMVGTTSVESSLVPFIVDMNNKHPSNINIVVSKDLYDLQYTNYNYLVITKHKNDPVLLTKKNVMQYLLFKHKMETPKRIAHHLLVPFILSCIGDRKRSIPGVKSFGFTRTYNALLELYESGYIMDEAEESISISNLTHVIKHDEVKLFSKEDLSSELLRSYRVTDLESQYSVLSDVQQDAIFDQLTNRTDTEALMDINETYFTDFPLMLVELNNYDFKTEVIVEELL